jgi:U3 small nucleolar RNA-associated protein 7
MASVGREENHQRGRKRIHTDGEFEGPTAKRPKFTHGSSQSGQRQNRDRDSAAPSRELTPAELAHEKAVHERSLKYRRGDGKKPNLKGIKDKRLKGLISKQEERFKQAADKAARAEILHTEQAGFMEAESGLEATWKVKQMDIEEQADLLTISKIFRLNLPQYGPYTFAYSRNGRYLLLGGEKGHVALIDWHKNKLLCELNLGENVRHVCFLHNETMFAVAQKKNVYIYDKSGTELHRLKNHRSPHRVLYLPYHFLLCSVGREGILRYQDTSTGELIAELRSKLGHCVTIAQNPRNAIVFLGHTNGSVTLWAPTVTDPLVKILCHRGAVTSIVIDPMGKYMVTAGEDGCMKVWDLKQYHLLQTYYVKRPITHLALSDTGLLALSFGAQVQIWKDFVHNEAKEPYMLHQLPEGGIIRGIAFCPFEDVLGIGHEQGFSSIIVPGSGEAHIDTFAANPYETKKQRREATVQKLLDKIQPSMIVLNPDTIGTVTSTSQEQHDRDVSAAISAKFSGAPAAVTTTGGEAEESNIIGPRSGPKVKRGPVVDKKRLDMQEATRKRLQQERIKKQEREASMDAQEDAGPRSALDRFKSR